MTKATRARCRLEFKLEAVWLVKGGQSVVATTKILGIVEQARHDGVNANRDGRLTEVLAPSRSALSRWRLRSCAPSWLWQPRRNVSDDALLVHIRALRAEPRGEYGWPRVWKELLSKGIRVGKERVRKVMSLHGVNARGRRKFKATTDSNYKLPVAENVLNRELSPPAPNSAWVSDIAYAATDEGRLYLAVLIDRFSR